MIEQIYKLIKDSEGVSTDTRSLKAGELFFALSGPNFDGNKFALQALDKGAIAVIVDKPIDADKVILVDNVLECLQELSTYHRNQLDVKILALTGSNGKTTSKELIYTALKGRYRVQATKGNLNNHIGVPLSLLSLKEDVEIAVIEMGANHQREIAFLCNIARPDIGLITNIGKAHLAGFGGIDGVAKGKLEMFDFIASTNGFFFTNLNDERIAKKTVSYEKGFTYSTSQFTEVREIEGSLCFEYGNENYRTNLTGEYNLSNIAAAIEISSYFGISAKDALEAICSYNPNNNRSQKYNTDKNTLILDHYNANPTSVIAALTSFEKIQYTDKVVILGEMAELGDDSRSEHKAILNYLKGLNLSYVLLIGDVYCSFKDEKTYPFYFFRNNREAEQFLNDIGFQNKRILLKGSRSSKLESIIPFL